MQITLLKSKLHHARITHVELEYEGSCAIDCVLLEAAGIREYEQIQIYNLDNGKRFTTYAIRATAGSGTISLNGAAAHQASVGDRVIICTYASMSEQEAKGFQPHLVYLDASNRITRRGRSIPEQVA